MNDTYDPITRRVSLSLTTTGPFSRNYRRKTYGPALVICSLFIGITTTLTAIFFL
jgi:hypothetical protein